MSEKYFLVIHCQRDDKSYAVPLSAPPDINLSPLGVVKSDGPCIRHSVGKDAVSPNNKYRPQHNSSSVLVSLSLRGDAEWLKEVAVEKTKNLFTKKGKERE